MNMAERLKQTEIQTIVIKEAVPVPDGTLINGELVAPLPYQKIQESQVVAETFNTCVCHIEGEHRYCVASEGVEVPLETPDDEHAIPLFETEIIPPIGKLVKDPVIAKRLMKEAARHHLEQLESAGVDPKDFKEKRKTLVKNYGEVSQRLTSPGKANKARHDAIEIIKRAELSAPAVAAVVVFASSKIGS